MQALELPEAPLGPPEPPPHPVTTRLPLPRTNIVDPAIVAASSWPPTVQTGEAFALSLAISNRQPVLQRLRLAVGDTSGFVFTGAAPACARPQLLHLLCWQACTSSSTACTLCCQKVLLARN